MELYSIHYVNVPQWYLFISYVAPPHLFFSVQRMCSLDTFLIILSFILRSPQHLSHGVGGSDGYSSPHHQTQRVQITPCTHGCSGWGSCFGLSSSLPLWKLWGNFLWGLKHSKITLLSLFFLLYVHVFQDTPVICKVILFPKNQTFTLLKYQHQHEEHYSDLLHSSSSSTPL